jgi:hypothetical protein
MKFSSVLIVFGAFLLALGLKHPGNDAHRGSPDKDVDTHSNCDSSVYCEGEDLVYEVSWTAIKLGQLHFRMISSGTENGQAAHNVSARIDSYRGLPFVDLHVLERSTMDDWGHSFGSSSNEKHGDEWVVDTSVYDSTLHGIIIDRRLRKDLKSPPYSNPLYDTLHLSQVPFDDGLSLLFWARAYSRLNDTVSIPTEVYGKIGTTILYKPIKTVDVNIDAYKHPIRTVEIDGKALFKGLYGMTGDFKGWFSDDPAAVPIRAEMEVLIGHATIELKSWHREGWIIPNGKE